jgi:hypothetical protein
VWAVFPSRSWQHGLWTGTFSVAMMQRNSTRRRRRRRWRSAPRGVGWSFAPTAGRAWTRTRALSRSIWRRVLRAKTCGTGL